MSELRDELIRAGLTVWRSRADANITGSPEVHVAALVDEQLPIVERHIARERVAIESQIAEHVATREQAARADTAEQIAVAIEAERMCPDLCGNPDCRDDWTISALNTAASIARQHAEERAL